MRHLLRNQVQQAAQAYAALRHHRFVSRLIDAARDIEARVRLPGRHLLDVEQPRADSVLQVDPQVGRRVADRAANHHHLDIRSHLDYLRYLQLRRGHASYFTSGAESESIPKARDLSRWYRGDRTPYHDSLDMGVDGAERSGTVSAWLPDLTPSPPRRQTGLAHA